MINRIELKTPWPYYTPARWMAAVAVTGLIASFFVANSASEASLTPLYALGPIIASLGLPALALVGVALVCAILAASQAPDILILTWSLLAIAASGGGGRCSTMLASCCG